MDERQERLYRIKKNGLYWKKQKWKIVKAE